MLASSGNEARTGRPIAMQVLFLSAMNPYPPVSGGQKIAYTLLKLYAQRANVHLICFYEQSQPETPDLLQRQIGDLCVRIDALPLPIHYGRHRTQQMLKAARSVFSPYPFRVQKFFSPVMNELVSQVAQANAFDLVHCEYLHMSRYLDHFRNVPIILEEQNVEWEIFARQSKYNPNMAIRLFAMLETYRLRKYEIRIANGCAHLLVLSERDGQLLQANGVRTPVAVFRYPVLSQPLGRFCADEPVIISLGNLAAPGRQHGTIWFYRHVWPTIKAHLPRTKWRIVGDNPSSEIRNYHDGKSVFVEGLVDETAMTVILRKAQVCIVPLFIGGGIRIKILDMMGWGIPCVSTSVGVQGIEPDLVLASDSAEGFAGNVIRLLTEPGLWHRMSSKGLNYVQEHHSPPAIEAKFAMMVDQVLETRKAGGHSV